MNEAAPAGPGAGRGTEPSAEPQQLRQTLRRPGYLPGLVLASLIGIPVSLVAFWFLVLLHEAEHALWTWLPHRLGYHDAPWWWPLPLLTVAGLCVAVVVRRLPGAGGHVPAGGLQLGTPEPAHLPGVLLAALASLPLGAVLGPEAPLIALGGGLAVWLGGLVRRGGEPSGRAVLGAAGAASAVSAIFGNPLVAAVLLMEAAGFGGPVLFATMLPCLLAGGVGALIFTGFGRWTGLPTASLAVDTVPGGPVDAGDVLWAVVLGLLVGVLVHLMVAGGRLTARFTAGDTAPRTVLCAVAAGGCAAVYAALTGRSPHEVAASGQAALATLAADPHAWGVGPLLAVLALKGLAYALCLGSLRGGAIFPALFLGAAAGVLLSPLPGLGVLPGMAAGMAAASAAVVRLPVSAVLLVVLLLGAENSRQIPAIILAAVTAFVATELLPRLPELTAPH